MNKLKITIIAIMVALTAFLFLLPNQPDAVWLKWLSIALWIVLIIIIARNSDLFERPKEELKPEDGIAPELLAFLKEKGVLKKFMDNYNSDNAKEWRRLRFLSEYTYNLIVAFEWNETPEGPDFWFDLDDEYRCEQSKKS